MQYYPEKSYALKQLESTLEKVKDIKIKAIFACSSPLIFSRDGHRQYMQDTELYIMFENNLCVVIDYLFVDSFGFEFRELNSEEKEFYNKFDIKDFFNTSNDIYDYRTMKKQRNETCKLSYGCIKNIEIRSVTAQYEKWLDTGINFVEPTSETFDQIKFIMDNGKSFTICAAEASDDGYVYVWSEDLEETITEFEVETN